MPSVMFRFGRFKYVRLLQVLVSRQFRKSVYLGYNSDHVDL